MEHRSPLAEPGSSAPFRIFVNYRRNDTSGYAGRLYDALAAHSPAWYVFMDIDTIEPGVDFSEVIEHALESCDVVLSLIGPGWLQASDGHGHRRLEAPDDFVRMEILGALDRDVRVIPVLVGNARMPGSDELPPELARLSRRNAIELSDGRWHYDVGQLLAVLDGIARSSGRDGTPGEERATPRAVAATAATAVTGSTEERLEAELEKWNWGAFLLTFVWGLGNGVYRSFLVLVPFYGFYEWFLLGRYGNRWAWKARPWPSVEGFRETQRRWVIAALIVDVAVVVLVIISSVTGSGSQTTS